MQSRAIRAHPPERLRAFARARRTRSRARPCTPPRACRTRSWRRWRAAGAARRAPPLQLHAVVTGRGAWCPGDPGGLQPLLAASRAGAPRARCQRHRLRRRGRSSRAHRRFRAMRALPAYQIKEAVGDSTLSPPLPRPAGLQQTALSALTQAVGRAHGVGLCAGARAGRQPEPRGAALPGAQRGHVLRVCGPARRGRTPPAAVTPRACGCHKFYSMEGRNGFAWAASAGGM
jgi:hypothetical protein